MDSKLSGLILALVPALGTVRFERLFYDKTREIFNNEQCNVFVFRDDRPVESMLTYAADSAIRALTRECAVQYLKNGFLTDPVLPELRRNQARHGSVVRLVTANEVADNAYRERYYEKAAVSQKMATAVEIDGKLFYLNFYRDPSRPEFSALDRMRLADLAELLCSFLAKHYQLTRNEIEIAKPRADMPEEFRAQLTEQVRAALLSEGAGLTAREADICAAIAMGKAASAIAIDHGISCNTVATHRKRAYAKLGISSQSELFARYYESLTNKIIGAGVQLRNAV